MTFQWSTFCCSLSHVLGLSSFPIFSTMVNYAQDTPIFTALLISLTFVLVAAYKQPVQDSCLEVTSEIQEFHVQGDVVVLRFPFVEGTIRRRQLVLDNTTTFHITHRSPGGRDMPLNTGRVVQWGRDLWLLPSLPSDTGTYTCILRSARVCVTGSISLTVYETGRADLDVISYHHPAHTGERVVLICPHLGYFNRTESPRWYKESSPLVLAAAGGRYSRVKDRMLAIRDISPVDKGFYTCRITVLINNTLFNISRTLKLDVFAPTTLSSISSESPTPTTKYNTLTTVVQYPRIIAPLNGSFTEATLWSSLVISCKVFAVDQLDDSTEVTWLINGKSVETLFQEGRVYQEEQRERGGYIEVRLIFMAVREDDTSLELKCRSTNQAGTHEVITTVKLADSMTEWLTVGAVVCCCFLTVLSMFLCHLIPRRREKHGNYILTGQDSTF